MHIAIVEMCHKCYVIGIDLSSWIHVERYREVFGVRYFRALTDWNRHSCVVHVSVIMVIFLCRWVQTPYVRLNFLCLEGGKTKHELVVSFTCPRATHVFVYIELVKLWCGKYTSHANSGFGIYPPTYAILLGNGVATSSFTRHPWTLSSSQVGPSAYVYIFAAFVLSVKIVSAPGCV